MCLLIVAEHGRPDREVLEAGETFNRDGIGVAYRRKGDVHFTKGITLDELDELLEIEKPPFIVHFRLASAGGKHPGLCHPFPVTKSFNLQLKGKASDFDSGVADPGIIAHNGHIQNWKSMAYNAFIKNEEFVAGGPWSDTRFMSWIVANNGPNILHLLEEKVAYMSAKSLTVFSRHLFTEHRQSNGNILLSQPIMDYMSDEEARGYMDWYSGNSVHGPRSPKVVNMACNIRKRLEEDGLDEAEIKTIMSGSEDEELEEYVRKNSDVKIIDKFN